MFHEFENEGVISRDGILKKNIAFSSITNALEETEAHNVITYIHQPKKVVSRTSLEICSMSPWKVVSATNAASQFMFGKSVEVFLRGGELKQLLSKTILRMFKTFTGKDLTPYLELIFCRKPLDVDWLIYSEHCDSDQNWEKIIRDGLVVHLASELQRQEIKPTKLAVDLNRSYSKAAYQPKGSYPNATAIKHGGIALMNDPLLHIKYIEMTAFPVANDKSHSSTAKHYFNRVIAHVSGIKSEDYTFSNDKPNPARDMDSLCLDVSSVEGTQVKTSLKLSSFKSLKALVQGVFDAVMHNMTFDSSRQAEPNDFVRTAAFFMTGGRCLQQGWIDKTIQAFSKAASEQKVPWPVLLAKQLTTYVIRHFGPQQSVMIILSFNIASLLHWKRCVTRQDMCYFWAFVFNEIAKGGMQFNGTSCSVVEAMRRCLSEGGIEFSDIYAQLQLDTAIKLHNYNSDQSYPCHMTITDGHLFYRIENSIKDSSYYIFLPYDLASALNRAPWIHSKDALSWNLHSQFIGDDELLFGMEATPSKAFVNDSRIPFEEISQNIRSLLFIRQEKVYHLGFLLALAHLAQKKNEELLKMMVLSFFEMLIEGWVSNPFKIKMTKVMKSFLESSHIDFDLTMIENYISFQNGETLPLGIITDVIKQSLLIENAAFKSLAELFFIILLSHSDREAIVDECATLFDHLFSIQEAPLEAMRTILSILQTHPAANPLERIKVLLHFLDHRYLPLESEAIEHLSEALLLIEDEAMLRECSKLLKLSVKGFISRLIGSQLQRMCQALAKIGLFNDAETLNISWGRLIECIPDESKLSETYLYNCMMLAGKYHIWPLLSSENKESFQIKYKAAEKQWDNHYQKIDDFANDVFYKYIETMRMQIITKQLEDGIAPDLQDLALIELNISSKDFFVKVLHILASEHLSKEKKESLRYILKKIQGKPNELLLFWVQGLIAIPDHHAGQSAIVIRILILERMFEQFFNLKKAGFDDAIYQHMVQNLSEGKTKNALSLTTIKKCSHHLLKELHDRKLYKEIVAFASIVGALDFTLPVSEYVMKALSSVYAQGGDQSIELLQKIASVIYQESQLKAEADHIPLLQRFALRSSESNDFIAACKWLGRCRNQTLNDFSFKIISTAIAEGASSHALQYLVTLKLDKCDTQKVIKIIELFLVHKQYKCVVDMVDHIAILLKYPSQDWKKVADLAFQSISQWDRFNDSTTADEMDRLLLFIYQLIVPKHTGTLDFWEKYIQMAVDAASSNFIDHLFTKLIIDREASFYFTDPLRRRRGCWEPLLKRMSSQENGSQHLLESSMWVEYLFSEIKLLQTPSELATIAHHFLRGALKALKSIQDVSERSFSASRVLDLLMSAPFQKYSVAVGDGGEYMVNTAELALYILKEEGPYHACERLVAVFTFAKPSPFNENRAVKLCCQAIKRLMKLKDPNKRELVCSLIGRIVLSQYMKSGDHFILLEFLLNNQSNHLNENNRGPFFGDKVFVLELSKVLEHIFLLPSHLLPRSPKTYQVSLASKAVSLLWERYPSHFAVFLRNHMNRPSYKLYVKNNLVEKTVSLYIKKNMWKIKYFEIFMNLQIINRVNQIRRNVQELGITEHNDYFPIEKAASEALKSTCRQAAMVALIIFGACYFITTLINSMNNKE